MFTEDQLLPLSALQHWLYYPRQWALIHLEQAWAENKFTAEGRVMRENAHEGADEMKAGVRITLRNFKCWGAKRQAGSLSPFPQILVRGSIKGKVIRREAVVFNR
jgi:hypothetical protein